MADEVKPMINPVQPLLPVISTSATTTTEADGPRERMVRSTYLPPCHPKLAQS